MKTDSKLLLFVMGAVAVFLAVIIEKSIFNGPFENATPLIILRWAFVEEVLKFIPLLLLKDRSWKSLMWGAAFIALGFAMVENIVYLKGFFGIHNSLESYQLVSGRLMGAVILHATVVLIPALALAKRPKLTIFAIVLATIIHALWNMYIALPNKAGLMLIVETPIIFIVLALMIERFITRKLGIAGISN